MPVAIPRVPGGSHSDGPQWRAEAFIRVLVEFMTTAVLVLAYNFAVTVLKLVPRVRRRDAPE